MLNAELPSIFDEIFLVVNNKRSYFFMKEGAYCECFYSPQDSNTRPYWSDN